MVRKGQVRVTYIALLIVGLLVGGVLGYFLAPSKAPADIQQIMDENQQLKDKVNELLQKLGTQEVTVTIWTIGPDPPSEYRYKNFEIAAEMLNDWLKMMGSNVTIKVTGEFYARPVEWGEYKNKFYLAYKAGEAPDIYLTGHEDIGFLAANEYIIPLDDYINQFWDVVYYDVIPTLWDAVKYKGKIWAVPQDTEARPMYFRKDILRQLGWTDDEIDDLPRRIQSGEFTLDDLLKLAKQAVDAGLVDRGILHRVKEGYDYFQFYLAYGGKLWNPETGKMVFSENAWRKTLQWFYDAVYTYGVINPNQFSGDWDNDFHGPFTSGKALFLSGGTWHKGEWIQKGLLTEQSFKDDVGFALHPAGEPGLQPVTLSHPLVYTITKQAQERGLADVAFVLITLVTNPHINSYHAVQSAHLAILNSQILDSRYTEDWFLKDVAYMLEYTTFIPNHPKWGDYSRIVFNILRAVETGELSPTDAYQMLHDEITSTLGDSVEVVP